MGIGSLDLFKDFLGGKKKKRGENLRGKGGAALKYFLGSLFEEEDLRTKARVSC